MAASQRLKRIDLLKRETPTGEEKRLREAYENAKRNRLNYRAHLIGCECAQWENHDGRCQGAYCYCH